MLDRKLLFAKVVVWRIVSIIITSIVAFIWTGNIAASMALTAILTAALVFAHFVFEIVWESLYDEPKNSSG